MFFDSRVLASEHVCLQIFVYGSAIVHTICTGTVHVHMFHSIRVALRCHCSQLHYTFPIFLTTCGICTLHIPAANFWGVQEELSQRTTTHHFPLLSRADVRHHHTEPALRIHGFVSLPLACSFNVPFNIVLYCIPFSGRKQREFTAAEASEGRTAHSNRCTTTTNTILQRTLQQKLPSSATLSST